MQSLTSRHPKRRAREAAIKKLAEFKPLPVEARNALIAMLLDGDSDFDSGDGIYGFRSTICYTLGSSSDDWIAFEAMLKILRKRSLDANLDKKSQIKWFDKSWGHYGSSDTGPTAIVRGLRFAPAEHHEGIKGRLNELLAELKSAPTSSGWAISEIECGIQALGQDSRGYDWESERYIDCNW